LTIIVFLSEFGKKVERVSEVSILNIEQLQSIFCPSRFLVLFNR